MEGSWGMSCHCTGQHTLPSYWPTRNLLRNLGFKSDSSIIEESAFTIVPSAEKGEIISCQVGAVWLVQWPSVTSVTTVTSVTSAVVQCDNCDKCDKCSGTVCSLVPQPTCFFKSDGDPVYTVWRFPVVGTFVLLDGNDPNAPKASKCRPPAAGRRSWRHQVILTPFPSLQAIVQIIINFGLEFSSNVLNV